MIEKEKDLIRAYVKSKLCSKMMFDLKTRKALYSHIPYLQIKSKESVNVKGVLINKSSTSCSARSKEHKKQNANKIDYSKVRYQKTKRVLYSYLIKISEEKIMNLKSTISTIDGCLRYIDGELKDIEKRRRCKIDSSRKCIK